MIIFQIIPEYYQFNILNKNQVLDLTDCLLNYVENVENDENFIELSIKLRFKEG